MRVCAPRRIRMRAASSVSRRLYERSRNDPYSSKIRGGCVAPVESANFSWVGTSSRVSSKLGRARLRAVELVFMTIHESHMSVIEHVDRFGRRQEEIRVGKECVI